MSHNKELQTLGIWLMLATSLFTETAISDFKIIQFSKVQQPVIKCKEIVK